MLDIDGKIPLACCLSWAGSITVYVPICQNKQNAGILSAEVPRKFCWWYSRQEACPRVMRKWVVWPWKLRGCPENFINQGIFRPREKEVVHKRFVCISAVFDPLSLYSFLHFGYLKEKKRNRLYVVSSISFQIFLYRHLKLSYTLENSVCYCYTSYKMTDQFLGFQVQMNSYSRNWNTPY